MAVLLYLAFLKFYVGIMHSEGYSYAFTITAEIAIGFFIIYTMYIFRRKCFRNFRRCCSCFKKGGAKTIKNYCWRQVIRYLLTGLLQNKLENFI